MRWFYRCLLWLHPPAFRREFGGEMLWLFDETEMEIGARPLLADACRSLGRQWVLRSGAWKIAAALLLAVFQVAAGGGGMLLFGQRQVARWAGSPAGAASASLRHAPVTLEFLMILTVFLVAGLAVMVLVLVSSLNRITHRRRSCSSYAR